MESTVEQRLTFLENRVKTLEALLHVRDVPVAAPVVTPPSVEQPWPPAAAPWSAPERKPLPDLEELLGGRVLGWVGGIAVVIAAVFFVVMAVHNGWIGVDARMALAFAASGALVGLGSWLYERRGRTQAALATVAAGIAALYASTAATTLHYHLLSPVPGLVIAGVVGALALVLAVRWDSQEIAGIGIVGFAPRARVRRRRNEHELARVHGDRAARGDRRRRPARVGLARGGRVRRQRPAGGVLAPCRAHHPPRSHPRGGGGVLAALRRGRDRPRAPDADDVSASLRRRRCSWRTPPSRRREAGG